MFSLEHRLPNSPRLNVSADDDAPAACAPNAYVCIYVSEKVRVSERVRVRTLLV